MPLHDLGQLTLKEMNDGYRDAAYHSWGRGTDPVSLRETLNKEGSSWVAARGIEFVERLLESESEISREIADSISNYGTAACALVGGGTHWVLVTGFDVEESPKLADSSDTAPPRKSLIGRVQGQLGRIAPSVFGRRSSIDYSISGFYVNNPGWAQNDWFASATSDDLEHCDSEDECSETGKVDECGTGFRLIYDLPPGVVDPIPLVVGAINHGPGTEIIAIGEWRHTYMTVCPTPTSTSTPHLPIDGKFVAVRADRAPASTIIPDVSPPILYHYLEGPVVRETKMDLTTQQIKDAAFAGVKKHRLDATSQVWQQIINERNAGEPELVHRIERKDRDYYLVPLLVGDKMPAMARVDAASGTFLAGVAVSRIMEGDGYGYVVPPIGAIRYRLLEDQMRIVLPGDNTPGGIIIDANNYRGLFWQSCLESFSPYYPFFKLDLNGREVFVPLDVFRSQPLDDKVITRYYETLTTDVYGM